MKQIYILIFAALTLIGFTGCTAYKSSTTPDDVYYSPGKGTSSGGSSQGNDDEYYSTPNENYVRMRVDNPSRWSYFDDYNYDYYGGYSALGYASPYASPYYSGYGFGWGYGSYMGGFGYYSPFSFWNSYYAWNSFYNPYYGGVVVANGKNFTTPAYARLSTFNPAGYQGRSYVNRPNGSVTTHYYNGYRPTTNSQNYRPVYNNYSNNNNNYNRPTYNRPMTQSVQPMRSAPSNFGSSGGGGGGAMRGGGGGRPGR